MSTVQTASATSSPAIEAAARRALQRLGVSPTGLDQFLGGQVVLNPADRSRLAGLAFQGGCSRSELQRLGVSPPGADQFLNGWVVADPADRRRLAGLAPLGFTPPIGSNKGSLTNGAGSRPNGIIAILIGLRAPT